MASQKKSEDAKAPSLADAPHLGDVSLKKLTNIGVMSVRSLYTQMNATTLASLTGKKTDECSEIMLWAGDVLEKHSLISKREKTAWELYEEQKKEPHVSTGCTAFDNILGGGIKGGYVTEVYGENRSGKTQTCISLSINALADNPDSMVIYVDTENKLKVKRLVDILIARSLAKSEKDAQKYLDRLLIWRPANSDEQLMYLNNAAGLLDSGAKVKLFVIDSILSLFQSEYMIRGEMKSKFNLVKPMMLNLMKLSLTYKIPILIVNTVYQSPTEQYGADPIVAAGGNSVGHPLTYRIKVREVGAGAKHRAKMVKSPEHPESEADFKITEKGIEDV